MLVYPGQILTSTVPDGAVVAGDTLALLARVLELEPSLLSPKKDVLAVMTEITKIVVVCHLGRLPYIV